RGFRFPAEKSVLAFDQSDAAIHRDQAARRSSANVAPGFSIRSKKRISDDGGFMDRVGESKGKRDHLPTALTSEQDKRYGSLFEIAAGQGMSVRRADEEAYHG